MPAAHKEAGDYRAGLRSRRRLDQVLQTRDQGILLQEGDHQGEQEKLSQILLCLEENIRDGREVLGQCVAEIKQIRREMMEGLQRHQDPAPGADHPLPHAADPPLPHAAGVGAAEPRHQSGGGGVGQVQEGAGLLAQADPGHDGLAGRPRAGEW